MVLEDDKKEAGEEGGATNGSLTSGGWFGFLVAAAAASDIGNPGSGTRTAWLISLPYLCDLKHRYTPSQVAHLLPWPTPTPHLANQDEQCKASACTLHTTKQSSCLFEVQRSVPPCLPPCVHDGHFGPSSRTEFPAALHHSTKCRQTPTHDDEKQQHFLTKEGDKNGHEDEKAPGARQPGENQSVDRAATEAPTAAAAAAATGEKGFGGVLPLQESPPRAPALHGGPALLPRGALPQREGDGEHVRLVLQEVTEHGELGTAKTLDFLGFWLTDDTPYWRRSYKNGFVWHDLSQGDLILPAHGDEYVLKGSELLDRAPPGTLSVYISLCLVEAMIGSNDALLDLDRNHHGMSNVKIQNLKHTGQQPPHEGAEASPSSSTTAIVLKEAKHPLMQPPPPPPPPPPPAPGFITAPSTETRIRKPDGAQEATTQTDTREGRRNRGLMCSKEDPNIVEVGSSQPPTSSGPSSSSCAKMSTLQSLIRAELSRRNSYRNLEAEDVYLPTGPKLKAANMIMHLITCGSTSVKDHYRFGSVCQLKVSREHQLFAGEPKRNVLRDGKEGTSQRELH
ncbi:hypothetical protein BHE74_00019361 [Ensete ventricosum]|nr:hypothetical protein BHE74_00019361 [Ensete ventricosum]